MGGVGWFRGGAAAPSRPPPRAPSRTRRPVEQHVPERRPVRPRHGRCRRQAAHGVAEGRGEDDVGEIAPRAVGRRGRRLDVPAPAPPPRRQGRLPHQLGRAQPPVGRARRDAGALAGGIDSEGQSGRGCDARRQPRLVGQQRRPRLAQVGKHGVDGFQGFLAGFVQLERERAAVDVFIRSRLSRARLPLGQRPHAHDPFLQLGRVLRRRPPLRFHRGRRAHAFRLLAAHAVFLQRDQLRVARPRRLMLPRRPLARQFVLVLRQLGLGLRVGLHRLALLVPAHALLLHRRLPPRRFGRRLLGFGVGLFRELLLLGQVDDLWRDGGACRGRAVAPSTPAAKPSMRPPCSPHGSQFVLAPAAPPCLAPRPPGTARRRRRQMRPPPPSHQLRIGRLVDLAQRFGPPLQRFRVEAGRGRLAERGAAAAGRRRGGGAAPPGRGRAQHQKCRMQRVGRREGGRRGALGACV